MAAQRCIAAEIALVATVLALAFAQSAEATQYSFTWGAFPNLASLPKVLKVGDSINAVYAGTHNLYMLTSAANYASCSFRLSTPIGTTAQKNAVYTFTKPGVYYFACAVGSGYHCNTLKMKFSLTVVASTPPPLKRPPPPVIVKRPPPPVIVKKPPPMPVGSVHTVNPWSFGVAPLPTFKVGDKVVFVYNSLHDVFMLKGATAFANCDFTGASMLGTTNAGTASFTFQAKGTYYFACSQPGHCGEGGMKLTAVVM